MNNKEWVEKHSSLPYESYLALCKDNDIQTYEEYKESQKNKKYFSGKCFLCNDKAEFEGGDSRYFVGLCEEHALIEINYLNHIERIIYRSNVPLIDRCKSIKNTEWYNKAFGDE